MIPILIAPIINRFDLVERMLLSIDHPIERIVIVDNSLSGWVVPDSYAHLSISVIRPVHGLGYTGGINAGISQTPGAPWWMWTSADIVFGPGDLSHIESVMDSYEIPRLTHDDFTWGALNRGCVETIGLFDEWSFYPIYFDDNDYLYRAKLGGVEIVQFKGTGQHGDAGHSHSLTIFSDDDHKAANNRSWKLNREAYEAKWGGLPGLEVFTRPWDRDLPLWAVKPDPAGRLARAW